MSMEKRTLSATVRYTLFGALFGLCFPIVATLSEIINAGDVVTMATFLHTQATHPLLWVVDTAPLFLGVFAGLAGEGKID